jgi:multidrug efflux pump subunit AcrA (membrane-fusion protein)
MKKSILITTAILVALLAGVTSIPQVREALHSFAPSLGIDGPTTSSRSPATGRLGSPSDEALSVPTELTPADVPNSGLPADSMNSRSQPRLINIDNPSETGLPPANQLPINDSLVRLAQSTEPVVPLNPRTLGAPAGPAARVSQLPGGPFQLPSDGVPVPSASHSSGVLVDTSASLVFKEDIVVTAQADGVITKLLVEDGMVVKANAPIYQIDPQLAEKEIKIQSAELEQAKVKAEDESNVLFARAAEEVALQDLEMSNRLVATGAEDEMMNLKKRLEVKKSRFQIKVSTMEKTNDRLAVGVSEAKLEAAKVQLALRTYNAPWEGIVSQVEKHQHEYARAGEAILKLTDMRLIRVSGVIDVTTSTPPNQLLKSPAKVYVNVAPGVVEEIEGTVGYVAPNAKLPNQYPYWVQIENKKLADGQYLFRGGMNARVEITPRRP